MLINGLRYPQGEVLQLPKGPVAAARRPRFLYILLHIITEPLLGPSLEIHFQIHFQSPPLPTIWETSQPPGQHPAWAAVKQLGKP